MKFGTNLKRLRQRKNISQEQLAEELKVKQYVISSWEIGRSEPNIEQINHLSMFFEIPTDYLLGKETIMVNDEKEFTVITNNIKQDINDDAINEIVDIITKMDEKDKNKIIRLIKDAIELLK